MMLSLTPLLQLPVHHNSSWDERKRDAEENRMRNESLLNKM